MTFFFRLLNLARESQTHFISLNQHRLQPVCMVWSSFLLSAPSWDMIGIKNSRHPPSQSNTNQIIVFCLPFFLALCFSHVVFNQIWRALRLIVDTGLHYYPNFTREDALWYFDKFAWDNTDLAQKEVSFFHRAKQEVSSIFLESGLQSS